MQSTAVGGDVVNIPFSFLKNWCGQFEEESCIGQGGFGKVFCGVYSAGGSKEGGGKRNFNSIAVKRVNRKVVDKHTQDLIIGHAKREIDILRTFRHPNIIRLVGYHMPSYEQLAAGDGDGLAKLALVFDCASRGSIAKVLSSQSEAESWDWRCRVTNLIEVCGALSYLHCFLQAGPPRREIQKHLSRRELSREVD
jgi:serine/threonine protein kinase